MLHGRAKVVRGERLTPELGDARLVPERERLKSGAETIELDENGGAGGDRVLDVSGAF